MPVNSMLAETISKLNNSEPIIALGSPESSNVIRFQPQSEFQKTWRDRCLNENEISAKLQGLEPCPSCGCTDKQIGPGAGPHAVRLSCMDCGRFIKWVKRSDLPVLKGIESAFGGDCNE